MAAAYGLQRLNFLGHIVKASVLDPAEIDDHIDLIRTVQQSIGSFEHLCGRTGITVRESDYRADLNASAHIIPDLSAVSRRNTYRSSLIVNGIITERFYIIPSCFRLEIGMIYMT